MIKIKGIAAVNNLGYMGRDGKMMWRSSEDFKHFKEKTMGGVCIVGRKTYEGDLRGKGLPGRTMVVVGKGYNTLSQALYTAMNIAHHNLQTVEDVTSELSVRSSTVWVIGGLQIYKAMAPFFDEFHLSHINDDQVGDVKLDIEIEDHRCELHQYEFETNL